MKEKKKEQFNRDTLLILFSFLFFVRFRFLLSYLVVS